MVVDTNVLVSAFAFPGGPPERLWIAGLRGAFQPVTSVRPLGELSAVLVRRFAWEADPVERLVRHVIRASQVVGPTDHVASSRTSGLRDPDDDELLRAAVATGARLIVSGDRDVLDTLSRADGHEDGLRAVSPAEMLHLLP